MAITASEIIRCALLWKMQNVQLLENGVSQRIETTLFPQHQ